MITKSITRLVREGEYAAEVLVALSEDEGAWAPCISLADAYRLDDVREALRTGDLRRAARVAAHVYHLTPVEV